MQCFPRRYAVEVQHDVCAKKIPVLNKGVLFIVL